MTEAKIQLWKLLGDPTLRKNGWRILQGQRHLNAGQTPENACDISSRPKNYVHMPNKPNELPDSPSGQGAITSHNHHQGRKYYQHTSQYDIKTACLEKAKAQFIQANDTPCMTEPLYSEVQWLGMHLPAFDQITSGTYIPPEHPSRHATPLSFTPWTM